jgi:hypothetical protein
MATQSPESAEPNGGMPAAMADLDQRIPDPAVGSLSDDEIRELAVRLALAGYDIEHGLRQMEDLRRLKLEAVEEQHRIRTELLHKWIVRLEDDIRQHRDQLNELKTRETSLRDARFDLDVAIQILQLKKATALLGMRLKRLERERQFFVEEESRLKGKHDRLQEQIDGRKEKELQEATNLHAKLLEMWETDKDELQRRADVLKGEEGRITDDLAEVEKKVKSLREVGITRTIAGFLIWVGYTAFAAVGSVIGGLLQRRQSDPKAADIVGNFVRGFAALFGLKPGGALLWWPFVEVVLFVLVVLSAVMGLASLLDWRLKKFDPKWRKAAGRKDKRRGGALSTSRWQDIISFLTPGATGRFSLFGRDINRNDYVQLLAATPYLLLAAILVFLISALGLTEAFSGPGQSGSAAATLTTASIGAVITLLSTSACLLYATKVIEPRWNRFIREDQSKVGFWKYLRINWEFAVIMLSLIAAIWLVSFSPLGDPYDYRTWGLVAHFMALASMGLAYGLMYRGIFKDYDALYKKRQEYVSRIEEYILKPTLDDVFEESEPDDLDESLSRYRKALEYLDGLRIGNELNRITANPPRDASGFLKFWFADVGETDPLEEESLLNPRRRGRRLRKFIRRVIWKQRRDEPDLVLWQVAPEERTEYEALEEQIGMNRAKIEGIDKEVDELVKDKQTTESDLSKLEADLKAYDIRMETADANLIRKKKEYNAQREANTVTFRSAFLVGKMHYDYMAEAPEYE